MKSHALNVILSFLLIVILNAEINGTLGTLIEDNCQYSTGLEAFIAQEKIGGGGWVVTDKYNV